MVLCMVNICFDMGETTIESIGEASERLREMGATDEQREELFTLVEERTKDLADDYDVSIDVSDVAMYLKIGAVEHILEIRSQGIDRDLPSFLAELRDTERGMSGLRVILGRKSGSSRDTMLLSNAILEQHYNQ